METIVAMIETLLSQRRQEQHFQSLIKTRVELLQKVLLITDQVITAGYPENYRRTWTIRAQKKSELEVRLS